MSTGKRSVTIVTKRKDWQKKKGKREMAFQPLLLPFLYWCGTSKVLIFMCLLPHLPVYQIWEKCEDVYPVCEWLTCKLSLIWMLFSIFYISLFLRHTLLAALLCWGFYYLMKCVQLEEGNHSAFGTGTCTNLKRILLDLNQWFKEKYN